jgi:hypothetical protein
MALDSTMTDSAQQNSTLLKVLGNYLAQQQRDDIAKYDSDYKQAIYKQKLIMKQLMIHWMVHNFKCSMFSFKMIQTSNNQ